MVALLYRGSQLTNYIDISNTEKQKKLSYIIEAPVFNPPTRMI